MMSLATRVRSATCAMTLTLSIVALAACGGDAKDSGVTPGTDINLVTDVWTGGDVPTQVDVTNDASKPDALVEDAGVDIEQPPTIEGRLEFVSLQGDDDQSCVDPLRPGDPLQCTFYFESVEAKPLEIRYYEREAGVEGASWERVDGGRIKFSLMGDDTSMAELEPGNGIAITDAGGKAFVNLHVVRVEQLAQFAVKVEVMGRDGVMPIFFNIILDAKGRPPLTVVPDYRGVQPVAGAVVRLYRQHEDSRNPGSYISTGITCSELESFVYNNDERNMPRADILSPEVEIDQSIVFQNIFFEDLENDPVQMFTVFVTGKDANGTTRVVGCDDQHALVQLGKSVNVLVSMNDVPPRITGTYDVRSQFDLITALPPAVAEPIYHIIGFFESPAEEVLTLLCLIDVDAMNNLCEYIFNDDDSLTVTGGIAVGIIDGIVEQLGEGNTWGQVLNGGRDVSEILTNLTFESRITFLAEPGRNGLISESSTHEQWDTIRYRWTLDIPGCSADPDCGWNEFSFAAIAVDHAVEGQFSGSVNTEIVDGHAPFTLLTVDDHPLNIAYGALLNYMIKEIVLPRLAGGEPPDGLPRIDTYEELIKSILAGRECLDAEASGGPTCCQAFAENLAGQAGNIGVQIVDTACSALIIYGSQYIEQLLISLDFETGDPNAGSAFLLGTPPGMPCVMHDVNDDLQIDALGLADDPCQWQATLRINLGGGVEVTVDADFVGSRQ